VAEGKGSRVGAGRHTVLGCAPLSNMYLQEWIPVSRVRTCGNFEHSDMSLWSFQSMKFLGALHKGRRMYASWGAVAPTDVIAYRWMARQMLDRGMTDIVVPPIWAWHSCGAPGRPPTRDTWCSLHPTRPADAQVLLELRVPCERALLSYYGIWNDLVFLRSPADLEANGVREVDAQRMFDVQLDSQPWDDENYFDVQASMPFVHFSWIRSISSVL